LSPNQSTGASEGSRRLVHGLLTDVTSVNLVCEFSVSDARISFEHEQDPIPERHSHQVFTPQCPVSSNVLFTEKRGNLRIPSIMNRLPAQSDG
jgi:hypothetical protein